MPRFKGLEADLAELERTIAVRQCGPRTKMVLFADLDGQNQFPPFCTAINHPVAMDPAQGRNVIQDAGVCRGDNERVTDSKITDAILGFDHGHRAEQPSGVERVFRHARHQAFREGASALPPLLRIPRRAG